MKDLSQVLADALRDCATPPGAAAVPAQAAPAAVALLAETIRSQARFRRVRRMALGLAAAALIGGLGTWALLRPSTEGIEVRSAHLALMTRGETSVAVSSGARLKVGARVETTSGGSVSLRLQTGTQMWLEERSALEVLSTDTDQHLRLVSGRVRCEVVQLTSGQRFRIVTPDTEIEVRGTRFVVEWQGEAACPGQAATRVRVEEGTVWIRHGQEEAELHAGASWPPPCAAVRAPAVSAPPPVVELAHVGLPPLLPSSRLAEENRRFGEVLQARQQGETARALELLEGLRRDFPRGHLEEDVAAEELRLLAGTDPARAHRAAKAYLGRFPNGYARALALELVSPAP